MRTTVLKSQSSATRSRRSLFGARTLRLLTVALLALTTLQFLRYSSTKIKLKQACHALGADALCSQQRRRNDVIDDTSLLLSNAIYVNTSLPITNPHPFDYVINCPNTCDVSVNDSVLFLLNYVHTAVDNFAKRDRIRRTWGNESNYRMKAQRGDTTIRLKVRTVFILGLSIRRPHMQLALEAEARRYGDIVQENFIDTYR